ncbi:hypothetical protein F4778DRAFT_529044 [Xylariomycetidae sp. FL2044]|nr:hypothetical protein F4778DRAFT_529044 [Xylariomycetidae sp. FL2044]
MAARPLFSNHLFRGLAGVTVAGIGAGLYFRNFGTTAMADSGSAPKAFGAGPAFLSLNLESSEAVNHNTKRLRFQLPTPDHVSGLDISSALLTFSWPKGRWTPVLRPYTPVSKLDEPGIVELLVKKYPDGKQSSHLHSLKPGDTLRFIVKIPGYAWTPNKHSEIALIAGGAGITPMYSLIQGILGNAEDKTKITLVYGANSDADVLLKKEFDEYEKRFPGRFKAVYTVSRPEQGSPLRQGFVDKRLLEELGLSPAGNNSKVFVCGPPAMEASLVGSKLKSGILHELGYTKNQIHKF